MQFAIAIFTLGAVLILIGLVGGDLSYRGLTVPKVGMLPRFTTTISGSAFVLIALAVWLVSESGHEVPGQPSPVSMRSSVPSTGSPASPAATGGPAVHASATTQPTAGPVSVTISDTLTRGAIGEEVAVDVDGNQVGTLRCVTASSSDVLSFAVDAGTHDIAMSGYVYWPDGSSDAVSGTGEFRAQAGVRYAVTVNGDGVLGLALAGGSGA